VRAPRKALFIALILLVIVLQPFLAIVPQIEAPSVEDLESTSNTINTVGEEINWPKFWRKFEKYTSWDLEWYNSFEWVSVKKDLDIQLSYPQQNMSKINLVFDAPNSGNYRLTFIINKLVGTYEKKLDKYEISYDDIIIIFDWSDCVETPGLINGWPFLVQDS